MFVARIRCLAVAGVCTTAVAGLFAALAGGLTAPAADVSAAVTRVCTVVLLAGLAWGWATVLAGVCEAWCLAGGQLTHPEAHRTVGGVRRLVLAGCGVALTGALATPFAQAAPADTSAPVSARAPHPHPHPHPRMVVRRGDSLWSIAASEVQPGAGPATVDARWRAVYTANHGVIGDDPDLIHPGQHLRLPS